MMDLTHMIMNEIREQAFRVPETPMLEIRFKLLYEKALEKADPSEEQEIVKEIIDFERAERLSTWKVLSYYENVRPADILTNNSKAAFFLANKRYETGIPSALAKYMSAAFSEWTEDEGTKEFLNDIRYRRVLSETILDFNYASGASETMSLRLHAMMK